MRAGKGEKLPRLAAGDEPFTGRVCTMEGLEGVEGVGRLKEEPRVDFLTKTTKIKHRKWDSARRGRGT